MPDGLSIAWAQINPTVGNGRGDVQRVPRACRRAFGRDRRYPIVNGFTDIIRA